jgi:predicted HAD superfamily Cof-like phosphohydrolase
MKDSEIIQPELPLNLEEMTPYEMVHAMHTKFGINYKGAPRKLDPEEKAFRVTCLEEEVAEYEEAETLEDELDAIIDLMVFAFGTLERQGFPFIAPFREVMMANLRKELAGRASKSKRDFSIDLVKPDGWTAPEMKKFVE